MTTHYKPILFDNDFLFSTAFIEILSSIAILFLYDFFNIPFSFVIFFCVIFLSLGFYRFREYLIFQKNLASLKDKSFYSVESNKLHENKENGIYIGKGFIWDSEHTKKYRQIVSYANINNIIDHESDGGGRSYIHNLGKIEERDIYIPLSELKHSVIAGSTRVGKTRFIELLSYQIIHKNEPLIIIDPKGDQELLDTVFNACRSTGDPQKFVYFSLAHPEKSASFNPCTNWKEPRDIATRVTQTMPQDGDSKPFTDFCWKVLVTISDVIAAMGEDITLKKLHRYSLQSMDELYKKAQNKLRLVSGDQERVLKLAIEKLRVLIDHPQDHFGKMITSLEPVLTSLATGETGNLLSPTKKGISWNDVIQNKRVVYFYLPSMLDSFTSSAVGKLVVQDFLTYIGQVYAYKSEYAPSNLIVDEFYSVMFPGYIDLLNKAGGANLKVFLGLQTTADITSASDESMMKQILGNINNKFYFRVPEKELAEEFCGLFGKVKAYKKISSRNIGADPKSGRELFTSGYSERLDKEEVDLISPEMIMGLPVGQAFVYTQGRNPYKVRIPLIKYDEEFSKISFAKGYLNVEDGCRKKIKTEFSDFTNEIQKTPDDWDRSFRVS
jgi:conjugal transfer pilus assembly protein TraD